MKADLVHLAGNFEGALARAELARENNAPSRLKIARREARQYRDRFVEAADRRIAELAADGDE